MKDIKEQVDERNETTEQKGGEAKGHIAELKKNMAKMRGCQKAGYLSL